MIQIYSTTAGSQPLPFFNSTENASCVYVGTKHSAC